MKSFLVPLFLILLFGVGSAAACFGPKLYLGVPEGARSRVLAEMVVLYLKEKTGVETVQVPVASAAARTGVHAATLDLALVADGSDGLAVLLEVPGGPLLLSGPRPLKDLRFFTVPAALKKLGGLLGGEFFEELVAEVEGGASASAVVGRALRKKRWI